MVNRLDVEYWLAPHLLRADLMEWLPIETAPIESLNWFLVYPGFGGEVTLGFCNAGRWVDKQDEVIHPTHWMPLPSPPLG